jgi:hypothetical protein
MLLIVNSHDFTALLGGGYNRIVLAVILLPGGGDQSAG